MHEHIIDNPVALKSPSSIYVGYSIFSIVLIGAKWWWLYCAATLVTLLIVRKTQELKLLFEVNRRFWLYTCLAYCCNILPALIASDYNRNTKVISIIVFFIVSIVWWFYLEECWKRVIIKYRGTGDS